MRIVQPAGTRGSLQFIQRLVSQHPTLLTQPLRDAHAISSEHAVEWRSPLASDEWAEYRDAAFLERVGLSHLAPALAAFWPANGPQWDALAVAGDAVLLVEAKAHVAEMASTCGATSETSRNLIRQSLDATRQALGATGGGDWMQGFYQLANRLAHLWFLRSHGVNAHLVLLSFTGETGMPGASTPAAFEAAYSAAMQHLGLHGAAQIPGLVHLHMDVAGLVASEDPEVQAGLAVAGHAERKFHHALRELAG